MSQILLSTEIQCELFYTGCLDKKDKTVIVRWNKLSIVIKSNNKMA